MSTAEAWLLLGIAWSVLVGFWAATELRARIVRRRAAARLAKAEAAFWGSLQRLVDAARVEIDATPARPVGQVGSVKRMREQIADNECRRLRADLDAWGQG